jgi:hypothetical protein
LRVWLSENPLIKRTHGCVLFTDATAFYHCTTADAVNNWALKTPPGFVFSLKIPRTITHGKVLADCDRRSSIREAAWLVITAAAIIAAAGMRAKKLARPSKPPGQKNRSRPEAIPRNPAMTKLAPKVSRTERSVEEVKREY